ncbi:thrombospondin type 3 repeat-containing protein [Idiomarina seosinensis]|uniref:PA14 domain-containing protein n=1 Tax=Idiomarina seosinensis TaxID=281739 RepID=A0A432ZBJ0_9GAMM|nr:thrombospondin type 3 repeat-containing protein [Idiomarina seosinensis]RUO75333.1 hypothetical protein CWI81_10190 [Idiomarina seosinensis]
MFRLSKTLIAAAAFTAASAMAQQTIVYTSDSSVTAYDPILPSTADASWPTNACKVNPDVSLQDNWVNPHAATEFGLSVHPWQPAAGFGAQWINAWNTMDSVDSGGPDGHNWTRYSQEITGQGEFVLDLLADNCSWVYIDGNLVGFQAATSSADSYPVTLNGDHTLEFIIFDGGGLAGGMFRLETNTGTTFTDSDDDGLTDSEETLTETDPQNPDSDGDGFLDGEEVAAGSDPNDPNSRPVEDSDADGVFDDVDACPATEEGAAVDQFGCSGEQNIANACNCAGPATDVPWKNHGKYVSCVAKASNAQVNSGLITQDQASALISSAARSDCGKAPKGKGKNK